MKRILHKFDKLKLGHKLHQLQKRYKRAKLNGYQTKIDDYKRKIDKLQEKIKNIR